MNNDRKQPTKVPLICSQIPESLGFNLWNHEQFRKLDLIRVNSEFYKSKIVLPLRLTSRFKGNNSTLIVFLGKQERRPKNGN